MATSIPDNSASFSLAEVAQACGGTVAEGASPKYRICGVHTDSRRVPAGGMFVALVGEHFDAHQFLPQVAEAGVGAALVRTGTPVPAGLPAVYVADTLVALGDLAAFHRRRWGQRVVAITGSAGKTTTKELTWAALDAVERSARKGDKSGASRVMRTAGNLNNLIGVPMTLLTLTPEHSVAVVELGTSRHGEIARLAAIAGPDVGVVTSVAVAHAEGLGSLSGVAREKADLLRALGRKSIGVYSLDCPALVVELGSVQCAKVSFGRAERSAFRLIEQESDSRAQGQGTMLCRYRIEGTDEALSVPLSMLGDGPAVDTAAALAVVVALHGVKGVKESIVGLAGVQPVQGRMSPQHGPNGCLILDDTYNANPASVAMSLRTLCDAGGQRGGTTYAVLGDMGELGEMWEQEHRKVGLLCAQLRISEVIGVGTAMKAAVRSAVEAGLTTARCVGDAADVAGLLAQRLGPNDVVLVKGSRSMKMERVVHALQVRGANA